MLSIQIDTKSLELVIYHQFNNIKLSFFESHMKSSFPTCRFILDAVRLLDIVEYIPHDEFFQFVPEQSGKHGLKTLQFGQTEQIPFQVVV